MCVDCRQLCLDALVEEGDENFDWRLSFGEFKRLLSQSFQPSVKGEFLVESDWKLLSKLRRQKVETFSLIFISPVRLSPFPDR